MDMRAYPTSLAVSYRRGPLAGRGGWPVFGRRPRPGDRVPDLACTTLHGDTTRLHAELGGRWALLAGDQDHATAALLPAVRAWLADRVEAFTPAGTEGPQLRGEVWLVRPDAHLAWRGRPDTSALRRWLEGALQHG
jgi:hypothetical protein